jgi:polysaccharide export outer membrane protein
MVSRREHACKTLLFFALGVFVYARPYPLFAEDAYLEGKRLLTQGRYEEAADRFRIAASTVQEPLPVVALDTPPTEAVLQSRLVEWHVTEAAAALTREAYLQALVHAERAVELEPTHRRAQQLLVKARKGFTEEKKQQARKASAVIKAQAAERLHHDRQAVQWWRRALKEDPKDASLQQALARAQGRVEATIPRVARAVDLQAPPRQSLLSEYRISVGDVVEVFIWQQPDLTRDVIIRPDGRVSFPLVGDVEAAGMTLTELDHILSQRLKTYLRFPDVSLAIKRFGGTKTIVLGEVKSPGVYVPAGQGRVLEVLAMAGGFTKDAGTSNVLLIRGGLTAPQIAKLDLESALLNGTLQENVQLQPNDVIYVPKGRMADALGSVDRFTALLGEILLGQSVATNFGVYETSGAAAAR